MILTETIAHFFVSHAHAAPAALALKHECLARFCSSSVLRVSFSIIEMLYLQIRLFRCFEILTTCCPSTNLHRRYNWCP